MKLFKHTHQVQYYETDQMKVVHHSNYIRWFEEARTYFLEQIGYPYDRMENELKIISPVLEVQSQYRSMVRFGDTVDILIGISSCNGIRATFSYEVRNHETGELHNTGLTRHCFLNEAGIPISLKKSYPELYNIMLDCMKE